MANITQRKNKNGSYTYRFRISAGFDRLTKKRQQFYESVKSNDPIPKRELNKLLREFQQKVDTGKFLKPSGNTVGTLLDDWANDLEKNNVVRAKTLRNYRLTADKWIKPYFENLKLSDLNSSLIENGFDRIRKHKGNVTGKTLSPQSVLTSYRVLSNCLNWAEKQDKIPINPMVKLNTPKVPKKEITTIAIQDIEKIKEYLTIHSPWALAPMELAYRTGARMSEVLALKWSDIDFNVASGVADSCYVSIQRSIHQIGQQTQKIEKPKTASSQRSIYLQNGTEILADRQEEQQQLSKDRKLELKQTDFIFADLQDKPGEFGYWEPYKASSLIQTFGRACKEHRIDGTFHSLRHTHATDLLKAGVNPKIVAERLGHSSITVTLDIYSHVLPTMQEEAINRLNNLGN